MELGELKLTPRDIVEGHVSVIELFNNKTRQRIQIYWDGHVEGLDENWIVKNLLPSRQALKSFSAEV